MSETLRQVLDLIEKGEVLISAHGYNELAEDEILGGDAISGVGSAVVIEDYPEYLKGPCTLVLQRAGRGDPIHVVWGIPGGQTSPAVLITAYLPDPARCTDDLLRRRA